MSVPHVRSNKNVINDKKPFIDPPFVLPKKRGPVSTGPRLFQIDSVHARRDPRYALADKNSSYSSAESIASASPGFVILTLTIQPALYGSLFTASGVSFRPSLTSTISPLTGVKISETAFTDSTEPNASCGPSLSPTRGMSI